MSEPHTASNPTPPRIMREEIRPALTPALEAAALQSVADAPAGLKELRGAALSALRQIGLPHSGSEEYSFIRVSEILPYLSAVAETASWSAETAAHPSKAEIEALIFPESRGSYLVILDGVYSPKLSHPGRDYRAEALEAAMIRPATDPAALSPVFHASLIASVSRENDAAAALAALFSAQPLIIRLAAKAVAASPLQVLHLRTGGAAPIRRRDTLLVVHGERLSEGRVLVRHAQIGSISAPATALAAPVTAAAKTSEETALSNVFSVVALEDGASLKWFEAGPEGSGNEAGLHFHKLAALQERDSRFLAVTSSTGARLARNAFSVDLRGQGAEAELDGATVLAGSRQTHNFVQLRHLAPNCSSRQHFKTVAADKSRASVDGTILVAEGAQLTNANQLINNLMLSDEARADSKPRLLIHADDVKCTHGATAGKLDPEQQFYLESRGLSPARARTLMTLAFIAEVVEKTGGAQGASGFHDHLNDTLLTTLKRRLVPADGTADASAGKGA